MQGCFSTMGCTDLDLTEVADLAGSYNIPLLEIRSLEGSTALPSLLAGKPGGWEAARQFLDEKGLATRVLGTGFKLVGN